MSREQPVAIPRERIAEVAERIGRDTPIRLIVLFGSVAADAPSPKDLDLAILANGPLDLVELTNRFIRELRYQEIDLTDLRRADPVLMLMVARDGTPVYERSPGEFSRFASLAARRFADTRKFRELEKENLRERISRLKAGEA